MDHRKYRIGNKHVSAVLTKPADGYRLLGPVKSLVHILNGSVVKPGEFLYQRGRPAFLLAHHHLNSDSTVFAALELNAEVTIREILTTINPVTQMKGNPVDGPAIKVRVCQDLVSSSEVLGLKVPELVYYMAYPATTNHKINGLRVSHVALLNGVYRVEVGS